LSVLQLVGISVSATLPKESAATFAPGQTVEIFAPEAATPPGEAETRTTFVKVGKIEATISNRSKTRGEVETLTVRGNKFSPDLIGGIVCDQAGATVGIVDSIEGDEAQIATADMVRAATKRVLERQASVPRPLLGVRGEPVEFAARTALLAGGWPADKLEDLIKAQVGILLTGVVPQTPAALARLKAGDIIIRVNDSYVKTAEQFSKLLAEAGSGEQVRFTIKRPDVTGPISIPVTLGGSFSSVFEGRFELPRSAALTGLQHLGIRTMVLTPQAATRLGAQYGLIVVSVQPDSPAARSDVREGDVIERIDGRIAAAGVWAMTPPTSQKKHTFLIFREGERKRIVVEVEE